MYLSVPLLDLEKYSLKRDCTTYHTIYSLCIRCVHDTYCPLGIYIYLSRRPNVFSHVIRSHLLFFCKLMFDAEPG